MYQRFEIIGNVVRDCETKFTPQAKQVSSFTVAINESHGEKESVTWINVTAWEKLAETCGKYVKKGMLVFVAGRLVADPATGGPRVYQRKDGTWGASYEVVADSVRFLSSKQEVQE